MFVLPFNTNVKSTNIQGDDERKKYERNKFINFDCQSVLIFPNSIHNDVGLLKEFNKDQNFTLFMTLNTTHV